MTSGGTRDRPPRRPAVSAEELARQKGARPVERVEDMAVEGVFESDEELDEFIEYTYANRRAGVEEDSFVVVVAADGSIPASELSPFGVGPGTRLRVVLEQP